MPPAGNLQLLGRLAISLVWFYQGLWCKVLGREPRHLRVMESSPVFQSGNSRLFLVTLGGFEIVLGLWVLSGFAPETAAFTQTALLLLMNTGGLLWARGIIPDPAGMLFQNFAFVILIWICR